MLHLSYYRTMITSYFQNNQKSVNKANSDDIKITDILKMSDSISSDWLKRGTEEKLRSLSTSKASNSPKKVKKSSK